MGNNRGGKIEQSINITESMASTKPSTIAEYIAAFPQKTQDMLEEIRMVIKTTVPEAEETISYAIPCFKLNNTYLIYFAGYKNYVSIYPVPKGDEAFTEKIHSYKKGKGTLQFSLNNAIPFDLIREIILVSEKDNQRRSTANP